MFNQELGENWGRDDEESALLSEFDNGSGNGSPSDAYSHDEYPQRTEKQKQERREWESDTLQQILSDQAGNGEDLPQAPDHSRHTPPGAAAAAGTATVPAATTSGSTSSSSSASAAQRHGAAMPGFVGIGRRNEAVPLPHVAQPWQPRPPNPAAAAPSSLQQPPPPPQSRRSGASAPAAEPWPLPHQQPQQAHQRPPWGYADPQGGGQPSPPAMGAPPQQQAWGGFYDRFGIPMADVPAMPNPSVSGYAPREGGSSSSSSASSSSAAAHGMLGGPHVQPPSSAAAQTMPGHAQQQQAMPTPAAAEAMAAYQQHMSGSSSSSGAGGGSVGMFTFPGGSLSGSGGGGHSGEMLGDDNESLLGDNDEWTGDEEGGAFEKNAGSGRESGGATKKRKGANASKADKDKANRDRNREHARNTRLRKKAYVAKLSQLVMDLSSQREALARERAMQATLEREQHSIRQGVIVSMLKLHASGAKEVAAWRALLDDNFVCTMPITPFRSFKQSEICGSSRVLRGVAALVADAQSLAVCVESVGSPSAPWKAARARGARVQAVYEVDTACMGSDNVAMARFVFCTTNATACGAACEIRVPGMLRCSFSHHNKVLSCEFMFDIMSLMQQLQCASTVPALEQQQSGAGANSVGALGAGPAGVPYVVPIVANTLPMACGASSEARAIITATAPFGLVHVNSAWVQLCGYGAEEVQGCSLGCLQGPSTDQHQIANLMASVRTGHPASMTVTNYRKNGTPFQNYVRVFPLSSAAGCADTTHYMAVLEEIPFVTMEPPPFVRPFPAAGSEEAQRRGAAAAGAEKAAGLRTASNAAAAADAEAHAREAGVMSAGGGGDAFVARQ